MCLWLQGAGVFHLLHLHHGCLNSVILASMHGHQTGELRYVDHYFYCRGYLSQIHFHLVSC